MKLSEEDTELFYKVERVLDGVIPLKKRDFAYAFRMRGK